MVVNESDFMDDPPKKINGCTQTRCISHPDATGPYLIHLKTQHWGPRDESVS